jgi:hypothetical protein
VLSCSLRAVDVDVAVVVAVVGAVYVFALSKICLLVFVLGGIVGHEVSAESDVSSWLFCLKTCLAGCSV